MDDRVAEFLARRMEGGNSYESAEARRRRRSDGTFMANERQGQVEIEYTPQGERNTDNRSYNRSYNRTMNHGGPDDDNRRRIGFGQGHGKSHWSEEEFVGDMEESLYHEVDDVFHYIEICDKVHKKGYEELAKAFYEIANEKFICAEFLRGQLKKIGSYNPSEHKELEEDLKHVRVMFRD